MDYRESRFHFPREKTIPLLVAVLLSALTILLWQISEREELENFRVGFSDLARETQTHLLSRLTEASNALRRYAARVEVIGVHNQTFLEVDSRNYLEQLPILSRIGIVDAALKTIWSYPVDVRAQVEGFDQSKIAERKEAFLTAWDKKSPLLSRTVELRSGGYGNLLPVALVRNGKFDGAVYGAIKTQNLFNGIVKPDDFQLTFTEHGREVFKSEAKSPVLDAYKISSQMPFGLADFDIVMTPTTKYEASHQSRTPLTILVIGQLFALLVGASLYKYMAFNKLRFIDLEWRKAMLQGAGHAVIAIDVKGVIQTFTQSAERLLGYKASEVVGRKTPSLFHVQDEIVKRAAELSKELGRKIDPGIGSFIAKLEDGSEMDENEWTLIRKDGSPLPVSISATAVHDTRGAITGYLAIISDLTAQKAAQKEANIAHERLQRVVQSTGEGVWERDLHTRAVRYIDAQAKKLLGLDPAADVTHEKVSALFEPDDLHLVSEALVEHQINQTPGIDIELRLRNRTPEGVVRWIRFRGSVVRDGEHSQLVTTISDVTEAVNLRLHLQDELSKAKAAVVPPRG